MLLLFTRSHCYHSRYVYYGYLPDLTVITPVCILWYLPDLTVITSVCIVSYLPISMLSHRYVCCCYLPDLTVITSVCMLLLFT